MTDASGPSSTTPLDGVRVLELTVGIAGQVAGMLLADLGADVVRPVPPDDQTRTGRPGWLCWNRGKTLVRPGATPPVHAAELRRLADRADVLLSDAHPGALTGRGLDATTVRARSTRIVSAWMPPIAVSGRWSALPHDDFFVDAVGGFAAHHPAVEDCPIASVVPTRSCVHGALGAAAVVAALVGREIDGQARPVVVSGLDAHALVMCSMMSIAVGGSAVRSIGKHLPGSPNFRLYRTGDGRWVYLAALSPDLFFRALEVLDRLAVMARDDVAGDFGNLFDPLVADAVGSELDDAFASQSTEHWMAAFAAAGVPIAPVSDRAEWLASDVVSYACPPSRFDHPEVGTLVVPGVPMRLSANPGRVGVPPTSELAAITDVWTHVESAEAPTGPLSSPDLPLRGLRVVDLSTYLAAPLVGAILAEHGADVVKIESPDGDPYHVYGAAYTAANQRKPRLTLNLKDPDDRRRLLAVIGRADVMIDNLRPANLERLGLGESVVGSANADLVRCSVSAYGHDSPFADFPGFDPIMQSLSGLAAAQGGLDGPIATTAPVHDTGTAAIGALGTLAALFVRVRTGRGQRVSTSLAAVSTLLQSGDLTSYPGRPPSTVGSRDFTGPSSWRHYYRASDRWLAVAAHGVDQRAAVLDVLGHPEWAELDDADRTIRFQASFAERPVIAWIDALASVGVPVCQVLDRLELGDPFLVEQHYSHVIDAGELGSLRVLRAYSEWPGAGPRPTTERTTIASAEVLLEAWPARGLTDRDDGRAQA